MQLFNTEGIVLKTTDYGEFDRLYLLLTLDVGKVLARVHGARRSKNLIAGHLIPFLPAKLFIKEKGDMYSILEAETKEHYTEIGYQAVARLHLVAEIIDKLTMFNEVDGNLYNVLKYTSHLLTGNSWWQLSFAEILAKVVAVLGVSPSTRRCVITGDKVNPNEPIYWSGVYGGVVQSSNDRMQASESFYLIKRVDSLKLLKVLMQREPVAHRLQVDEVVAKEAEYLLLDYMQIYVQQNLRALPFVHSQ